MHIAICINRIPDPETPPKLFRLDERTNRPVLQRVSWVAGPFDENALETALQFRESAFHDARLTALSLGPAENQEVLRRALALKCDDAIHVKEEAAPDLDSAGTARVLAAAIRKLGDVDLVLCGRQVGDWDGGQIGQLLAEELGFSCVTLGWRIEHSENGSIRVPREVAAGLAVTDARLPAVVSMTNTSANQIRIPKVKDAMAAYKMPITTWTAGDIGLSIDDLLSSPRTRVEKLSVPDTNIQVDMVRGDSDEEMAVNLARRLVALNVL